MFLFLQYDTKQLNLESTRVNKESTVQIHTIDQ